MHPFDPREHIGCGMGDEMKTSSIYIREFEEYEKTAKDLDQVTSFNVEKLQRGSSIKRLHDMLNDSQSDMRTSVGSWSDFSAYDIESEVFFERHYYLNKI